MAQRVEGPINLQSADKRQYTRVPWGRYADGAAWRLTRSEDWPFSATSSNVLKMARSFAEKEGYVLLADRDSDSVTVRFISHKSVAQMAAERGSVESAAEHFGLSLDVAHRAVRGYQAAVLAASQENPFTSA